MTITISGDIANIPDNLEEITKDMAIGEKTVVNDVTIERIE
jgi:hypothetical protein